MVSCQGKRPGFIVVTYELSFQKKHLKGKGKTKLYVMHRQGTGSPVTCSFWLPTAFLVLIPRFFYGIIISSIQ
ncbi:MAG: hypothetical protein JXA44_02690 [Methanospirillaceae archaeon]|nr:hypothetical protein [Methanospirillaceae archaeon]